MAIVGREEVRTALINQRKFVFVDGAVMVMLLTEGTLVAGRSFAIWFCTRGRFPPPVSVQFTELLTFRVHRLPFPFFDSLRRSHGEGPRENASDLHGESSKLPIFGGHTKLQNSAQMNPDIHKSIKSRKGSPESSGPINSGLDICPNKTNKDHSDKSIRAGERASVPGKKRKKPKDYCLVCCLDMIYIYTCELVRFSGSLVLNNRCAN